MIKYSLYCESGVTSDGMQITTEIASRLTQLSIARRVPFRAVMSDDQIVIATLFDDDDEMAEFPSVNDFVSVLKLSDQYDNFTFDICFSMMAGRAVLQNRNTNDNANSTRLTVTEYCQKYDTIRLEALKQYLPNQAGALAKKRLQAAFTNAGCDNLPCGLR